MTAASGLPDLSSLALDDAAVLLSAVRELSQLRDLTGVMRVVRGHARSLTNADGVTFVLREGEQVFYADEDAIGPLWKGRRFPIDACISGWAMLHKRTVAIPDIYRDDRVPVTAYRPTFVKSLMMVPIGTEEPVGAIGAYWASHHSPDRRESSLLEALAGFTATAVSNAQLYQEARDAVRARDEWLGIACHELRTPLTSTKLQLDSANRALSRGASGAELRPRLQRAERSLGRLTRLVERLLDYTRMSQNALSLERQKFDLARLAEEICDRFRQEDRQLAIRLVVTCASPVVGVWDPLRLDEVITNLVSNAIKYGNGTPVRIEVSGGEEGARFSVSDGGRGIPAPDRERIFRPFTRLDDSGQGAGLGLWIVRQIVQAHGGSIDVQSEDGAGTTFTVLLPALGGRAAPPLVVV